MVSKKFCKQFSRRHNMNNLRKFCAGLILIIALTVPAFAGHIECPGVVEPPPPETESVMGEMPNGIESTDTVTGIVISIFLDILPFV
jgi:heme/copper-type cytochrome/quinol oxidase subunit 4